MAAGGGEGGCPMVKINGRRVSLSHGGLKQASRQEKAQAGQRLAQDVRAAVKRACGDQ